MRTVDLPKPTPIASVPLTLLEQIFDQVPDVAFFIKDLSGRYVAVNGSLAIRHGLSNKEDAIGRTPSEICSGEFGRIPAEQDRRVLSTGEAIVDHLEMQWEMPGRPVWCLTTKLPIIGHDGRTSGIIGISRDVRIGVGLAAVPTLFAEVIEQFERELSPEASPSWLAKKAKMAAHQFARTMKLVFGLTPSQYIAKTRLGAATNLLLQSDTTIAHVAHVCGYSDHSAFSRAFKKAIGTSPNTFRSHRKELVRR